MACDGEIDHSEVNLLNKIFVEEKHYFNADELQKTTDKYIEQLKKDGSFFLQKTLNEIKGAQLNNHDQCELASIAVKTIEIDRNIHYNEVAFFKKIRLILSVSDEQLLKVIPPNPEVADQISPEEYLLPDIIDENDFSLWNADSFASINLNTPQAPQ